MELYINRLRNACVMRVPKMFSSSWCSTININPRSLTLIVPLSQSNQRSSQERDCGSTCLKMTYNSPKIHKIPQQSITWKELITQHFFFFFFCVAHTYFSTWWNMRYNAPTNNKRYKSEKQKKLMRERDKKRGQDSGVCLIIAVIMHCDDGKILA